MQFEDIYQFFNNPPPTYLNRELAVCYILNSLLLQEESYGTELIEQLNNNYSRYRLSDTVLYGALKFLEESGLIIGYWQRLKGRGRPRKMYKIVPEHKDQVAELAELWCKYISD